MATNTQTAAETKDEAPEAPQQDGPLLDLSDGAVKRMIKESKKRGYVTVDELNAVLPSEEVTSEQIEDTMSMLSDMGINVVESDEEEAEKAEEEEVEEEAEGRELVEAPGTAVAKKAKGREAGDRTDDPVRMYLREMGSVELLSREGEIAIAKRIEAGREAMIAGLCESPLTFQAIIIWRDELNGGKVFLRDIIDLEATYAGPDAKNAVVAAVPGADAPPAAPAGATQFVPAAQPSPPPAAPPTAPYRDPRANGGAPAEDSLDGGPMGEPELDDDDMENSLSLAAIEAELKPKVLDTFDKVASEYKRLRRLQEQVIEFRLKNTSLSP